MNPSKYDGSEYLPPENTGKFTPAAPGSPIKNAPSMVEGENYDPKQRIQYSDASYTVHSVRPEEPAAREISPAIAARHQQSVSDFPGLNLSAAEYVILLLRRHVIGVLFQIVVTVVLVAILLAALAFIPEATTFLKNQANITLDTGMTASILLILCVLLVLSAYITTWVYRRNVLFLTNESIIQERQFGLFSKDEQTISLGSIEDARYVQSGIIQMMFDYGTIDLTVEGHGTSYIFPYTSHPKRQTDIISNAIESFKNGRPVEG